MKEFWLLQDNNKLRLPVPPSNYAVKGANNNTTFVVEGMGETSFIGKPKLSEIAPIQTFFPNQVYSFCQYSEFPKPWDCVSLIEKWRLSGNPIRYIVTDTIVNILCSIEDFEYKEEDGTGDIKFTLTLKEYKIINANATTINTTDNTLTLANTLASTARPISKTPLTQYTVKEGDNLYTIAKMQTGDASNAQNIAAKNNISDIFNVPVGMVINL